MTKQEIKELILANCVDKYGDIDLTGLDFSDFDGNVNISEMKVKNNLLQGRHEVGGYLAQSHQYVHGDLYQENQWVDGDLHQGQQQVEGSLLK